MPGYIEDRWFKRGPADPSTGKPTRVKTTRHGRGKRWRISGIPGVRDRSFTREADAKAWLKASATDSTRGSFYDPRDGTMLLDQYVREYWWPHLRVPPTTRQSMESRVFKHILPHVGMLPLNRIGFDEVRAWQTRAEQDIDVGTLSVTWQHFSSIMQAAHKAKRVAANPFRDPDLKAPTVPKSKAKAWPEETVTAVRAALGERYRILVDLAAGAGLRQGEALGFSPDDMDGDVIHVTRQVVKVGGKLAFAPPKGNKERDAPLPEALARAVKAHMDRFPPVDVALPWVDPDRPNLPWSSRPVRTVRLLVTTGRVAAGSGGALNRSTFDDKQWKPALGRAGVIAAPTSVYTVKDGKRMWSRRKWDMPREDGFHVLRHTFASVVLAAGETITQLAAWLGHSDPAFTLRTYVHFMPKSGKKGIEALGEWLSRTAANELDADSFSSSPDSPQSPQ